VSQKARSATTLNVKDPEAHRLAQAIGQATGETMTRVVIQALRERYERLQGRRSKASVPELLAIARRASAHVKGPTSITPHFSTTNAASRNDCRTSAIAGILFREFEAAREMKIIHDSDRCLMSVANFVELCIVIEGQLGAGAGRECDMSFWRAGIAIEAVTIEQG
jgi:antitoxin VapB